MFDRYNIVDNNVINLAALKQEGYLLEQNRH